MQIRKISILRRLSVVCWLLCVNLLVWAQAPVYTCDFEEVEERGEWKLNVVANESFLQDMENKWWIGKPGNFSPTGSNGLYISSNEKGDSAVYTSKSTMFICAMREMSDLPAGRYNLYFDWKCYGKANSIEGLYVCWVPDSIRINGSPNTGDVPGFCKKYKIGLPNMTDSLYVRKGFFGPGKAIIQHDGTPHKLVFLWLSKKGISNPPSVCIDNIELRPQQINNCQAPSNIKHTITDDNNVILSWKGNADKYDVRCYDILKDKWLATFIGISQTNCTIPIVEEGAYTFILRSHCSDTTASDFVQYTEYIYHKGDYCIDYMDLNNQNCYIGTYKEPFTQQQKVDSGYSSIKSRHTLCYMTEDYDANTNHKLRVVPEGYKVSVRLGDELGGKRGEGVKYTYKVASKETSILKVKYAMVLPNPHDSTPEQNPRFGMDILCDGTQLADSCGYVEFIGAVGPGGTWKPGSPDGQNWLYRDWSEFAINLRAYVGKTLTIQIYTTDCEPGAHPGYAYFVLDCESGEMSGLNCGEDNPTTQFVAPDGFDYVWYHADNPLDTLGRKQTYEIGPMDTTIYNVNVINKTNDRCWYTLTACGMPRIPIPRAKHRSEEIRCENVVTFYNDSSYIELQNMLTGIRTRSDEPISSMEWDFGDGSPVAHSLDSVVHIYPKKGGLYVMHYKVGISGTNFETCAAEDSIILDLPDLSLPTTEVEMHLSTKDYPFGIEYDGKRYLEDVDSTFTLISKQTGCDSLCHVLLKFHDPGPYEQVDTICYGDSLWFVDRWLKESGIYEDTIINTFENINFNEEVTTCDSIVRTKLYVDPLLFVNMPDTVHICPDDNLLAIPYIVEQGRVDSLIIRFDSLSTEAGFDSVYVFGADEEMAVQFPDSLIPNRYWATISYRTPRCEATTRPLCVEVSYSASVIWQKTDLLAITNEDYNGGYEFLTYQWYRDGEPINGANGPNLSVTDADRGHEFYVVVQRQDDGVKLGTCSVVYMGTTGIDNINLSTLKYPISVYTLMGIRMTQINNISEMNMLPQGMYILTDGETTIKWVR